MKFENILYLVLMILILVMTISYMGNKIQNIQTFIEECKAKGYDGAKFVSWATSEVECSNFTQAEKDTNEIKARLNK